MNNPISFPGLGISVDPPSSFSIGGFSVHFYGLIIGIGLLLAVLYGLKRAKEFGPTEDQILTGVLIVVPIAIVCARLYYCVMEWDQYRGDLLKIINIRQGGLAIYGGVIGAAIGAMVYCRVRKLSIPAVLDLMSLGFLIGQSIGRWGNFMNREAFGCYSNSLLAMRIPQYNLPSPEKPTAQFLEQVALLKEKAVAGGYEGFIQVHPTFLYESIWNIVGFVLLHKLSKKRQYDGQIALLYVAWYGLGRAFIEGLRMDSLYWGPVRVSQLLAAISCVLAVAVLIFFHFRPRKELYVKKIAQNNEG